MVGDVPWKAQGCSKPGRDDVGQRLEAVRLRLAVDLQTTSSTHPPAETASPLRIEARYACAERIGRGRRMAHGSDLTQSRSTTTSPSEPISPRRSTTASAATNSLGSRKGAAAAVGMSSRSATSPWTTWCPAHAAGPSTWTTCNCCAGRAIASRATGRRRT